MRKNLFIFAEYKPNNHSLMKKIYLFLMAVLAVSTAYGKTLRVNNATGTAAPYTNVDDALTDAEEGDVIILEASTISYGDFEVGKGVTIQGEGYWRDINNVTEEGAASTFANNITLAAPGAKVCGLSARNVLLKADNTIVTRCNVNFIKLSEDMSFSDKYVSNCIIHQNYTTHITGDSYSAKSQNIQITNNIITAGSGGGEPIYGVINSIIRRNTFNNNNDGIKADNSVIEKNINAKENYSTFITTGNNVSANNSNTFTNDKKAKEAEEDLNVDAGAFSGKDPYVLSGIVRGVRLTDLVMPESVEQGSDLEITVKIATQR